MAWKVIGITGGSAVKYGGQDLDKINNMFNGVADVDTVDINSNWQFRTNRARIRNLANTFNYIIASSAIVADRTITLPLLTAADTFVTQAMAQPLTNKTIVAGSNTITGIVDAMIGTHTTTKISTLSKSLLNTSIGYIDQANTWAGIQKFDVAMKLKPVATPTTDASYGQLWSNSGDSNKPYFVLPSGTAFNLTGGGGLSGAPPYIYDTFPATYDITSDDTVTSNGLWRVVFRGQHPGLVYDVGQPGDGATTLVTGTVTRYGMQVNGTTSRLFGAKIVTWTVRLKKTGTPTGNVTATVRNSADVVQATATTTLVASTLTTSFADVTFTFASPVTLANGDRLLLEYAGANGVIVEIFTTDQFDTSLTRRTSFNVGTGLYTEGSANDLCGQITVEESGQAGVRAPTGSAFTRVMYMYPYSTTNVSTSTSSSLVLTEGPSFTDFDITLSVRTKDQLRFVPDPWEAAWVMFRYTDAYHHYYLVLKSNSTLELGKKDNVLSVDEQYFLSTGVGFTYTESGWNKVRIKVVSNHITVWIDDIQKIDMIDDGSLGAQGGAPNTSAVPSSTLYGGKMGLYNEDAVVEFSPMTVTDLSAGSASSSTASYVTMATDSSLTSERVLTAGSGITITDAGAGNTVTVLAKNRTVNKISTESEIVSSTTETDILAYTVPASMLEDDNAIRVSIKASCLNNSGSDRTITFKIKYGATTMYSSVSPAIPTSSGRRVVGIDFLLYAKNSVTSQGLYGKIGIGDTTSATLGLGDLAGSMLVNRDISGANATENSAIAKTLSVTITLSASASTVSFKTNYVAVEVLN